MNVTISARHCEIPESLRSTTERRIARLNRYHPRLAQAEVTYDRERTAHDVEIRLAVDGESPLIARASGDTFRAALERGIQRVLRQLKRGRERRTARRPSNPLQ